MIVHYFSLPVQQVRINIYYFRLMLVLVIPQLKLRFLFLIRDFILFLMLLGLFAKEIVFLKVLSNPRPFGPASW